jgi:hypothetical protein
VSVAIEVSTVGTSDPVDDSPDGDECREVHKPDQEFASILIHS